MSKAAELVIRGAVAAWLVVNEARIAREQAEVAERRAVKMLATKSRALRSLLKKAGCEGSVVCRVGDRDYLLTVTGDRVEIRPVESVTAASVAKSIQDREQSRERK